MGKDIQQPGHPAFDDDLLRQLSSGLTGEQQLWLSGYLYGISTSREPSAFAGKNPVFPESPAVSGRLTIIFGSQTGNSRAVARQAAEQLGAIGWEVDVQDMSEFTIRDLKKITNLLIVVSTYGEGEPPAGAEEFHAALHAARAPKLDGVRYSVCALGDRSYAKFCQTGIEFDNRLSELGATRISARVDCDVDFHEDATSWINRIAEQFQPEGQRSSDAVPASVRFNSQNGAQEGSVVPVHSRKNPFQAEILEKIQLNGRGSARETWHVELALEDSGLRYQAGDALGIFPDNPDGVVEEVLKRTGFKATETVTFEGKSWALGDLLQQELELTTLNRDFIQKHAERNDAGELKKLLANPEDLIRYSWGRDVADLLREHPPVYGPQVFVDSLNKIKPRLYSIASGGIAYPDEVHLTIGAVRYESNGRRKEGAASTHIADRLAIGSKARVFVETNEYFRLPEDGETPVIMIGPGTGIAPFRAFLQDREERGDKGPNWLFFGNPHFTTDFLYQTEWQKALRKGMLRHLNVAFSRDQKDKVYVQHKLLEQGKEVYAWLENGARMYVCGDKTRMAPDVRKATRSLIQEFGGHPEDKAMEYFRQLVRERRYVEDVY